MAGSIPRSGAELTLWLTNFSTQVATIGASVGLSAADITREQKRCSSIISAIQNSEQKQREWRSAAEAAQTLRQTQIPALQTNVARMKTSPGWTPAIAQALGVVASSQASGPLDNYKPVIRSQIQAGRVEIKFTRKPVDGVNVYTRKRGENTWRFLGRWNHSPCVDETSITTSGSAEIREYRILGVKKDREVGQPSDIVVVTTGD